MSLKNTAAVRQTERGDKRPQSWASCREGEVYQVDKREVHLVDTNEFYSVQKSEVYQVDESEVF